MGCGGELLSSNLQKLVADGKRKLLLNLTDLTQIDSSGLGIIVRSYVSLRQKGGDLKLLCPWGRVLQVLNVLRLLNLFPALKMRPKLWPAFGHWVTSQNPEGGASRSSRYDFPLMRVSYSKTPQSSV